MPLRRYDKINNVAGPGWTLYHTTIGVFPYGYEQFWWSEAFDSRNIIFSIREQGNYQWISVGKNELRKSIGRIADAVDS